MDLVWLQVPQWKNVDGLIHGFLGRGGGRSTGAYATLNVSFRVGDDPAAVTENLCDLKRAVGMHDLRIVTMKQVHGEQIVDVKEKELKEAGEGDAMVTQEAGLFLGVLTADCVPILFWVRGRRLVAVVHAGWRGTVAGLACKMVNYLKEGYGVDPACLEAALGPAVGDCCYEIGAEVSKTMIEKWGRVAEDSLQERDGQDFMNLRQLNRSLLMRAGVPAGQIVQVGPCTSCASNDFFSYRRARGETGRQMSFIGWLK